MKKILSILLCLCMFWQNLPMVAFAAYDDNLCDHHLEHTAECGYREGSAGSACTHEHSEGCYGIVDCSHTHGDCGYSEGTAEVPCGHVHDESCGYVQALVGTPCANAETDPECDHTGDCGYAAAVEGQPCGHTACDDACGYAPATEGTPCTHVCEVKVDSADSCYKLLCSHKDGSHDSSCGYVQAVEAHDCHYECAECAAAPESEEPSEESSEPAPVCNCGTDDPDIHATTCAVYVRPENPQCFCAEKCTEVNEWCDICGFDHTACTGTDAAVVYSSYQLMSGEADQVMAIIVSTSGDDKGIKYRILVPANSGIGRVEVCGYNDDLITVIIPSTITLDDKAYNVTGIAGEALKNCSSLTSISIPASVTSIGNGAFKGTGIECTTHRFTETACDICDFICSHKKYEEGKCTVCGLECDHSFYPWTGKCTKCKKFMAALVEIVNVNETYYTHDEVVSGKVFLNGGTIRLCDDIFLKEDAYLTISNGTLDLNGFSLTAASGYAVFTTGNLTICNNSEREGSINNRAAICAVKAVGDAFHVTVKDNVFLANGPVIDNGIHSFVFENTGSGILDLTGWENVATGTFYIKNATNNLGSSILLPKGYVLMYNSTTVYPGFSVPASARITVAACTEHSGGTATCTTQAICETCGANYGVLKPDYHTSEEFAYTANEDGTTHTKVHKCCGATAGESEPHTFDSTTGKCGVCEANMAAASTTVDGTITYHETVDEAIDEVSSCTAEDGAEVMLLKDHSKDISIFNGVFTLNLNGNTVHVESNRSNAMGVSGGTVTVTGGTLSGTRNGVIVRGGTLNITDGTVITTTLNHDATKSVDVQGGVLNVSGGTITGPVKGVYVQETGTVNITGGTIRTEGSKKSGSVYLNNGTVNISGGTFYDDNALRVEGGKAYVTGGTFHGENNDIYCSETGTVQLSLPANGTTGAAFPEGLTANGSLSTYLGEGVGYWLGGKQVALTEGQTEITGGDVTVKAACDHSGSRHTTATDNGNGKHSFTCTICGSAATGDHNYDTTNHTCVCGKAETFTLRLPDQSLDVTYGTALADALEGITPEKPGHNHTGWTYYWLDENGGEQPYTGTTMPAFELCARPVFEAMEYTITWDMSGCSYELSNYPALPAKLAYNVDSNAHNVNFAKITAPEGYEFKGFTDGDGNELAYRESDQYRLYLTVSGDMTVKAVIEPKFYMATWKSNDGSYEKEFKYGETITIPTSEFFQETFRRAGCTLTGWTGYTEGMTMPLGGVTFTATWQIDDFTLEDTAAVYNGEAHTPDAAVSTFTEGKDYTVSYADNVNAGTASVTVTGIGSCTGTVTKTFVIAKAPAPVITFPTALNEITYGQPMKDVKLSFYTNVYGRFQWTAPNGISAAGTGDCALDFYPEDRNNYDWESCDWNSHGATWIESRSALCTTGTVVVNRAPSEIETAPTAKSLTYTGQPQELVTAGSVVGGTLQYSVNGGEWSEVVPTASEVGYYQISYQVVGNSNYKGIGVTALPMVRINKAKLIVTAENHTITYGDAPAANGVTGSGFVNDESFADLSGELTYTFNYERFGDVGTYKITPAGLTSDNYDITFADGTLTVNAKAITVVAEAKSGIYGDADPELTYTVEGLVNDDELTGALSREAGTDVGAYAIIQGNLTAGSNYAITFTGADLTISKRSVTITAKNQTIPYGEAISQTEITSSGLVSGHSAAVTLTPSTTMLTENGTITASNAVIKANGADVTANYEISYEDGKLVIEFDTSVIDALDPETVNSDNQSDLEEVLETIEELLEEEGLTEEQKKTLADAKADAKALLDVIEAAQAALDTENTEKVEDVTAENVKPEDKEALEDAKAELEKALTDNGGNYTDDEKTAIQKEIRRIEGAIEALENAEAVEEAIKDLPKTVEPDDEDDVAEIEAAKKAYEELTIHEKSLIHKNLREKLEALLDDAYDYDIIKGDNGKWTKGSGGSLSFTANGPFSKFLGIEVDGKEVDEKYYDAKSGSTIITLKKSFLKKLSTGKHTITVLYTDGETSGTFKIRSKSDIPATGDDFNIMLSSSVCVVSFMALAALFLKSRKHKQTK